MSSRSTECQAFFMEAHTVTTHANFILTSLPNAEIGAVESIVRKLYAVRSILRDLDDPSSTPEELEHLIDYRLWRDVRKDSLEAYCKIFKYLEDNDLLDMTNSIQRLCLYVVLQPRVQQSLNRSSDAWNMHRVRTAGQKTPIALYELSREYAKTRGYWTGDPGDDLRTAQRPSYGLEDEMEDGVPGDHQVNEQDSENVEVNDDDTISYVCSAFQDMGWDVEREDDNWGIEVYCQAVLKLQAYVESH
ncbi:hypothetical protein EV361DRAFT_811824 [Lentinula raphanica]|nr:hypothetical protein F5880DRAFT_1491888 [Lentinula raphanica]KAJ3964672.1 hypothetical protein EV361DRAFT_811824 [Lentinula raphanica]